MAAFRLASLLAGAWLGLALVVWGMAALFIFDLDVLLGVGIPRRRTNGRRSTRRFVAGAVAHGADASPAPAGRLHAVGVGALAAEVGGAVRPAAVAVDGVPAMRDGETREQWVERVRVEFEASGIPTTPARPRLRIVKREPEPFDPQLYAHVRSPFTDRD